MKIGVEEEFIVIDPDTLYYTPGAPRIANSLIYHDGCFAKKISVELSNVKRGIRNLSKGFCIIEIKTNPSDDLDCIKDELAFLRSSLVQAAIDNDLWLLPTGLHPMFSSSNMIPDNCASLHVHLDYSKETYYNLLYKIPFLISVTANSPFISGKKEAMSNRCLVSPHMSIPCNMFKRNSDIIFNKRLNTVEVRALDTQITLQDTMSIVTLIKTISEFNDVKHEAKSSYLHMREKAIFEGKGSVSIDMEEYEILRSAGSDIERFLDEQSSAAWQILVKDTVGLNGLISSLWESMKKDKKTMKETMHSFLCDVLDTSNLWYMIPYSPFFIIQKIQKYQQDISWMRVMDLDEENVMFL